MPHAVRIRISLTLFFIMILSAHLSAAEPPPLEKIWSVVKPNQSYADFNPKPASQAMGGYMQNYQDGFKMLAGDKVRTGDFPGIQAGPAAAWGGYKEYPIKILFKTDAAPAGGFVLTVGLAGVSPGGSAELHADLNGTVAISPLEPGANDDVLNFPEGFADPRVIRMFFPSNAAAQDGKNTLTLTLSRGAWIVYDYMRLDAVTRSGEALIAGFSATAPPFLAHGAAGPAHRITTSFFLAGSPAADLALSALVNGEQFSMPLAASPGQNSEELLIPELSAPAQAVVSLRSGGEVLEQTELTLQPVRHFEITLMPHSHLDIGYPDQQPNIMIGQKMYLERALDLIEQDTPVPMHWTSETAWPVERLLKGIGPWEEYGAFMNAPEAALMQSVTPEFLKDTMRMSNAAMAGTVTSSANMEEDLNNRRAVDGSPQGWHTSGPAAGAWIQITLKEPQSLKYTALRGGRETANRILKVKVSYTLATGETVIEEHGPLGEYRERLLLKPPAAPAKSLRIDILDAADPGAPASLMDIELWTPQDPQELRRRLIKAVRDGRMEISAMHLNFLTELIPAEWLIRSFARAQFAADQTGVPLTAALMTDVPGYSWALPDMLSDMGVKYFYPALNPDRAFNCLEGMPHAFYWTGPAGGRVLTFRAFNTYNEGWWLGFGQSVDLVEKRLPSFLAPLTRDAYPYDMMILRMLGDITDDGPVPERLPEVAAAWNAKWAWPKLTIGNPTPFFQEFESRYGTIIPGLTGDWTGYWEDGAASSARETIMARELHRAAAQLSAYDAVQQRVDSYADTQQDDSALEGMAEAIYLYDEHTWGADTSIREPDNPRTIGQWHFKKMPLQKAFEENGLGEAAPAPFLSALQAAALMTGAPDAAGFLTLETTVYRIRVAAATGRVESIFDKRSNRELADISGGFAMNEFIYIQGIRNDQPMRMGNIKAGYGPDNSIFITGSAPLFPEITQVVRLNPDTDRIEFENHLKKEYTTDKEAVYFAFPLNAPGGALRLDVTGGVMQAETDQAPGASRDWISIQDSAAAVSDSYSILFHTPDAPLVAPEGLRVNTFQKKLPQQNTTLFSYVMNNYWHTNYVAGQDGEFVFRYTISGVPRRVEDSEIVNYTGAGHNLDALHMLTGGDISPITVRPDTVRVLGVKTAERGGGIVVRVQEMDGADTPVTVTLSPKLKVTRATVTDIVERPVRAARVDTDSQGNSVVTETAPARGYLTLLLE